MRLVKNILTMLILLGILIAQIAFIPLVNAQEGEVTLNPTDDTYCDSDNPDSNYGGQHSLDISKYEWFETVYEKNAWLKFNLSEVPDGAVVDVATLQLHFDHVSETYNVYAHSCSDNSWTELTLTYSNMPTFNATSMDSTAVSTSFEWYNLTVIDAVRKAVNGYHGGPDVVTIVLLETSLRSALSWVSFSSKEQEIWVQKLTIHWSDVIPEFPIWTSILLIIIVLTVAIAIYKRKLLKTPIH